MTLQHGHYFRARVDVHRKENVGSTEKAITIYGQPENCTNACNEILKVMLEEAKNTGKTGNPESPSDAAAVAPGEEKMVTLKILAHNNLIGRIIGKAGGTIKKIMEDTGTRITVSSISDISSFNMERVITIAAANVDDVSRAEAEISSKLRKAYEHDVNDLVVRNFFLKNSGCPSWS
jgi:insulin-like growth factor 2 mRNA-binding protein 1